MLPLKGSQVITRIVRGKKESGSKEPLTEVRG